MNNSIIGVYGASGFGREVMPVVTMQVSKNFAKAHQFVFIDDNVDLDQINGFRVCSYADFLRLEASDKSVVLAIANGQIRERLATQCASDGLLVHDVRAENVVQLDGVHLEPGAILCPFVTLTSNIRIGKYFHCNIYSYVAHDCQIGDFVTFAPSVKCNGNVVIHDHAYIGTGAILKQGEPGEPLVIGEGAVVGMGAIVTRDVAPGAIVVGNPARPLIKN